MKHSCRTTLIGLSDTSCSLAWRLRLHALILYIPTRQASCLHVFLGLCLLYLQASFKYFKTVLTFPNFSWAINSVLALAPTLLIPIEQMNWFFLCSWYSDYFTGNIQGWKVLVLFRRHHKLVATVCSIQ